MVRQFVANDAFCIDFIIVCRVSQTNEKDSRKAFSLGVMYTLPMLVNFQAEVYHDGIVRLTLMREDIPISKRLRGGFMVNTDKEYMGELKYIINKNKGAKN